MSGTAVRPNLSLLVTQLHSSDRPGVLLLEAAVGDNRGVDGMTGTMWVFVGLGGFGGFFLGRVTAEMRRARYDMRRVWDQRRNYRL